MTQLEIANAQTSIMPLLGLTYSDLVLGFKHITVILFSSLLLLVYTLCFSSLTRMGTRILASPGTNSSFWHTDA